MVNDDVQLELPAWKVSNQTRVSEKPLLPFRTICKVGPSQFTGSFFIDQKT